MAAVATPALAGQSDAANTPTPDVASSYNGSTATYRLLRAYNWGPLLMSLGYYPFRRPFRFLNWFTEMSLSQRRLADKSIGLLHLRDNEKVLDVACGRGMTSFMIRQRSHGSHVVGLDYLPENVQAAQALFAGTEGLEYSQGDAAKLAFPDASFDCIHCLEAAFHFPDKAQFLRECRRVLRPGGRLVVVDIVWRTRESRQLADAQRTHVIKQIWQFTDLFSRDEYFDAAQASGLQVAGEHDWTSQVTEPLLALFGNAIWLAKRPWGRRLLHWHNPQTRNLSDADWRDLEISADAHREQRRHAKYLAMVFNVPC